MLLSVILGAYIIYIYITLDNRFKPFNQFYFFIKIKFINTKNEDHLTFRKIVHPSSKIKERFSRGGIFCSFIFDGGRKISRKVKCSSFFCVNKFSFV